MLASLKSLTVAALIALPLSQSAQAANLTLEQAAKLIAAGSHYDIAFKKKTAITIYETSDSSAELGSLEIPSAYALVSEIRKNTETRTIDADEPVRVGWESIHYGNTKIYDIVDAYAEYTQAPGESGDDDEDWGYTIWSQTRALVGVVGPIVTTVNYFSGYGDGAAHPNASTDLLSVDGRTGKPMSLLAVAEESSVVAAIKANGQINKCLSEEGRAALAKALDFGDVDLVMSKHWGYECGGGWPYDQGILSRFAITGYSAEADNMHVVLELDYGPEVTRGLFFTWNLDVRPKAGFREALARAAAKTKGFLTSPADLPEDSEDGGQ